MSTGQSHDHVFEALANPYRRQLLLALLAANPQPDDDLDPLDLLARDEVTGEERASRVAVTHLHLPKLEAMGFVDWDRETGELSKGPEWQAIAPLLELLRDNRDALPEDWLSGSPVDG